jgi:hypothetical protein
MQSNSRRVIAEAVGYLGSLREALAALRNLEQLLASVSVGPKVLSQLVPEMAAELPAWKESVVRLVDLAEAELQPEASLRPFERFLFERLERVHEPMRDARPPITAKVRLALERGLRSVVPEFATAVEHLELLVEAMTLGRVTVSFEEMLHSRPEAGSDRPHRTLLLRGDLAMLVDIPARVALRALGIFVSSFGTAPVFSLDKKDEGWVLSPTPDEPGAARAVRVPAIDSVPDSLLVASAAFGRYGVRLDPARSSLTFPELPAH